MCICTCTWKCLHIHVRSMTSDCLKVYLKLGTRVMTLVSLKAAEYLSLKYFTDLLLTQTQTHWFILLLIVWFLIGLHTDMCALRWITKFLKALSCFTVVDLGKRPNICCLVHSVSHHNSTCGLIGSSCDHFVKDPVCFL